MLRLAPVPAAVGAVLLLAGCAGPAAAPSSPATARPPAFPRIPGAVSEVSQPVRGDWRLQVAVRDSKAAYADARARLVAAGYQMTANLTDPDGGSGQACTTALCVSFATDASGAVPVLKYEVFHSTGISGTGVSTG